MFKRKNPDVEVSVEVSEDDTPTVTEPPAPPQPPPLRTFILHYRNSVGEQNRTIYAHSFELGEDGTLAFVTVFQITNGPLVTAPRYVFNRCAWDSIEEIRADYPEMVTH